MTPEQIKHKYNKRINAKLLEMREAIRENTDFHVSGVAMWNDDSYCWSFQVSPKGSKDDDDIVDVTFTMAESQAYDGTEGGINFIVDIVRYGGAVLGGFAPYNYTDDVWVNMDNPEAIEERFRLFESLDSSGLVDLLVERM